LPDQLVNKRAIREAQNGDTIECWVELVFSHNNRKYELRRNAEVLKEGDEDWSFRGNQAPKLKYADEDGSWKDARNVQDAIERVLPKDLHSYFLFDGERIERIVQPEKAERTNLGRATKILLGMEILERGERRLNNARKQLEKELKNIGDAETQKLLEDKEKQEDQIEKNKIRTDELEKEIEAHQKILDEIQERLRQLDSIKDIQTRYDRLQIDQVARTTSILQNKTALKREIANHGYATFLKGAADHFRQIEDSLRKRGELPAGIKKQFVDDILLKEVCICDRPLNDHHRDALLAVEEWKKRAGMADVEETAIRMGGEVAKTEGEIPIFWERIDSIQQKDRADKEELSNIEVELENIREKLRNSPQEEIRKLEQRRREEESAVRSNTKDLGVCEERIKILSEGVRKLEAEIGKHEAKEEKHQLLKRRIEATIDARDRIGQIRDLLDIQLRKNLNYRIRELFNHISVTPYIPDLKDDYSLSLYETAGGGRAAVAPSQGESTILSFCFIGAIVEEAKKFHAKQQELPGPESAEFPIVMDSPFGSLDPQYRRQVCDHLHKLADQVVIFVTKTQWRGEVETTLNTKIGSTYVLTYFSPRDDLDRVREESGNRDIELNGKVYDLLKQSPNDYEFTEIHEVIHA